MSKKIIISTDSTSDVPLDLQEKYGIITVPLHVVLDGKTYDDLVDITPDDIYAHFEKTGNLPKTAATNMQEYIDKFKPYVDDGYEIIHFNIGSALSTSHQQCKLAAKELGNVYAVDSCSLSGGTALLALEAVEMAQQGMEAKEIVEAVSKMTSKLKCNFIVDKLNYLHAGGRCSSVAVLGANLLGIKPCIEISNKDGSLAVGKKYRGKLTKVLNQYVNEQLADGANLYRKRAFLVHAGIAQETIDELYKLMEEKNCFDEIIIIRTGCTISSHCGPDTLGILCMEN